MIIQSTTLNKGTKQLWLTYLSYLTDYFYDCKIFPKQVCIGLIEAQIKKAAEVNTELALQLRENYLRIQGVQPDDRLQAATELLSVFQKIKKL